MSGVADSHSVFTTALGTIALERPVMSDNLAHGLQQVLFCSKQSQVNATSSYHCILVVFVQKNAFV